MFDHLAASCRGAYPPFELAKLQPHAVRSTLASAGLYQMAHEMLKKTILDDVRGFYSFGVDDSGPVLDQRMYEQQVLEPWPHPGSCVTERVPGVRRLAG